VDFEHREVMHGAIQDFFQPIGFDPRFVGTMFASEDGFDQEDPLKISIFGPRLFGLLVLVFVTDLTVLERNFMLSAKSLDTSSEVAIHPAQILLSRGLAGKKSISPGQKSSAGLSQPKIGA